MTPFLFAHLHVLRLGLALGVVFAGGFAACLSDADVRRLALESLQRAGWTIQAAAAQIGISRQRLGMQLEGHDPLTCLARLAQLEGFLPAFIEVTAPRFGITVVRTQELAEILECLRGNKRMAKAQMQEIA